MSQVTEQISGYFNQVPTWPLVLLLGGLVFAVIYDGYHRRRMTAAAEEFRTAILSTLSGLYPEPTNWPKNIDIYLRARLPVMQEIVEDFRPNVPQENVPAYNRDWENYYQFCHAEVTDEKCASAESDTSKPDPKKKFSALVSNLLQHAS